MDLTDLLIGGAVNKQTADILYQHFELNVCGTDYIRHF